jgi:hypothetical protein
VHRTQHAFYSGPAEPIHAEIVEDTLGFLKPSVRTYVKEVAGLGTDVAFVADSSYHFDDCTFVASSQRVAEEQARVLSYLDPNSQSSESPIFAQRSFARSLHIVQDFYSHSNWVELGHTTLFNESLDAWTAPAPYDTADAFIIVDGDPPPGFALYRRRGGPYPQDRIPQLRRASTLWPALFSGSVTWEPGDQCPPQIRLDHAELNKDRARNADGTEKVGHAAAKALAVRQTHHEWCRVLALARTAHGEGGDALLFDWVSDHDAASDCGPATDLTVSVTDHPDPATIGQSLVYQVDVTNQGPPVAYGVSVDVTLPASGAALDFFVSSQGACELDSAGGLVHCLLGRLTVGQSASVHVMLTPSTQGPLTVSAGAKSHVPESNVADNSAQELTDVQGATLAISKIGGGAGNVRSQPPGIDCGAICGASFNVGDTVVLTAAPDAASAFRGWGGDCSGTSPTTSFVISGNATCTARFEPPRTCGARSTVVIHYTDNVGISSYSYNIEQSEDPNNPYSWVYWFDLHGPAYFFDIASTVFLTPPGIFTAPDYAPCRTTNAGRVICPFAVRWEGQPWAAMTGTWDAGSFGTAYFTIPSCLAP